MKRRFDRSENTLKDWIACASTRNVQSLLQCAALPHDSRRGVLNTLALFQSLRSVAGRVSDSSNSTTYQDQTHENATCDDNHGYPPSCRPTDGSVSIDTRFVFDSRMDSDFVGSCLSCSVIAARARDAREMYSVYNVSFGAEFGPAESSTNRTISPNAFDPGVFVIRSTGLIVPRIFSALSS